jgi:DNA invertase Pin-like site-specific DNA recombinase
MRAVVYARYSSDMQREASIEDQVRVCRQRVEREGWKLTATYSDAASSGASRLRPGYQKLLEDAREGVFDVVVAEALDRLSRDQEDVAALYKHLCFAGIRLLTLAEGEISELHVGLKGTMNALFLKDLAQKVRRGLEGRVRDGRSGGGLCYGYDVVREHDARGELVHGARRINEAEAQVVRQIFREFAGGRSPRAIALGLNRAQIPGPQGCAWGPSTIYGNWRRGTGILNNELYVGRLVWNRLRYIKDPTTRRRVSRLNPEPSWICQEVPELRIIDDGLWKAVKHRQSESRGVVSPGGPRLRPEQARRPAYLLSGLLKCGTCGGGFSKVSEKHYGCSNARNRGTCDNRLTIRREVIEASVLSGLKTHLMHPDLVKEFIAEFHREINRASAERETAHELRKEELARVERQIRSIVEAIKEGLRTPSMRDELLALESRKAELAVVLREPPAPAVRLHPNLAEIYRGKVAHLHEELNRPELREEVSAAIRSLIEEVRLLPENGRLEIELAGALAGILALTSNNPRRDGRGVQVTLVAGVSFLATRRHCPSVPAIVQKSSAAQG